MNSKIKILFAEDEMSLALIVKESLETRDFNVTHCSDGQSALEHFTASSFDILVLDVMMPKMDGFSLSKQVRLLNKKIPILFLTAKSQTEDVINGFHFGGNDYLKKPFSIEELIVRIQSLLNRNFDTDSKIDSYKIGCYVFHPSKQLLRFNEDQINMELTHKENLLLQLLISNKNRITLRDHILNEIWGKNDFFNGRSLDVYISKLRKKLVKDTSVQIINIRGLGYKLIQKPNLISN